MAKAKKINAKDAQLHAGDLQPPAAPAKPQVKAQKPQLGASGSQIGGGNPKVSSPETDFSAKVVPLNFLPRAGATSYAQELQERLKDVADEPLKGVYYLLPVKLPKTVYERLLKGALAMAEANPAWTERDQLEALVNFLDAKALTAPAETA